MYFKKVRLKSMTRGVRHIEIGVFESERKMGYNTHVVWITFKNNIEMSVCFHKTWQSRLSIAVFQISVGNGESNLLPIKKTKKHLKVNCFTFVFNDWEKRNL